MRLARLQGVEALTDRAEAAVRQLNSRLAGGTQHLFDGVHQLFERFGESGDAVESDHGDGAVDLMQAQSAFADAGEIAGAAGDAVGIGAERLVGLVERKIDFAPDPGEETGVECRVRVHGITSRPT